jgi:dTDP-4-dehydrorhamnose reductase
MKIFILGSTGMLGGYVASYFKTKGYKVHEINHSNKMKGIEAEDVDLTKLETCFSLKGGAYIGDTVINCIGLIKQKITDNDSIKAIKINSVFPHVLNDYCRYHYLNFIHVSTDCCFSGKKGNYTEEDIPDPEDIYGISKVAGEPSSCSVIRTSVIGGGSFKKSLIEWVLDQKENINGYNNHYWNGVTCLQLAKEMEHVIVNNTFWGGVRHYFGEVVTKAQLVRAILNVYGNPNNVIVEDITVPDKVDRTLNSIYTTFDTPPNIVQQLKEQKNFKK